MNKIRIEAEDYLSGKNGETYYDTDAGNKPGKYRDDDVDIQVTKDVDGGYNVWGKKGEWTTYELEIPQTGVYDVVVRVASSRKHNKLTATIGDQEAEFDFSKTGGTQKWQDVEYKGLNLSAGVQELRLDILSDGVRINYIELIPRQSISEPNPEPEPEPEPEPNPVNTLNQTPIRIEAEDYLSGKNGETYYDTDAGNKPGKYRDDDVDIQVTKDVDGGYNVWGKKGEWTTYELEIPQTGVYDVVVRVASSRKHNKLTATIGDQEAEFDFSKTGGTQKWQDVEYKGLNLSAGVQELRLDILSDGVRINYIELIPRQSISEPIPDPNPDPNPDPDPNPNPNPNPLPSLGKSFIGGAANQTFNGDDEFNTVNYAQATGGIVADLSTGIVTREFTPSVQDPYKILPVGDSITYGFVNTEFANLPQNNNTGGYRNFLDQFLIADGLGEAVDFVGSQKTGDFEDNEHEGYGGKTINFISNNIKGWLNAQQPNMVLLMIGTNDTKSNTNPDKADERLSALIDKITNHSPTTHVLVASIAPIDETLRPTQSENAKTYNAQIPGIVEEKVAAGKKVSFVDVNKALTVDDIFDGVHPSIEGYEKIANTWYDWIESSEDTLTGGIDHIIGTAYDDQLKGNTNDNIIEGGGGDDLITGAGGNDLLSGGSGQDIFILAHEQGTDTINDFTVGEDLLGLSGDLNFGQLTIIPGNSSNANDTWIMSGDEQLALLLGVQANAITSDVFTFA